MPSLPSVVLLAPIVTFEKVIRFRLPVVLMSLKLSSKPPLMHWCRR